jgi:hypothetical protein
VRTLRHPQPAVPAEIAADIREELAALRLAIAALAQPRAERSSFTVAEFLERHRLSESQYFKLKRQGRGPTLMAVGDVGKRISAQAERDWIAACEREAMAEAKAETEGAAQPRRSGRPGKARAETEEAVANH